MTAKEYTYKSKWLIVDKLVLLLCIVPLLVGIISIYRHPVIIHPLIFLFVLALPFVPFYFKLNVVRVTTQFDKYDRGKTVIISADRLKLKMIQADNVIEISAADVEKVELYEQKRLGNFAPYNYVVIYTYGGMKLLITDFTIPLLISEKALEKFLRKKPRSHFRKRFNYIDEEKFKPWQVDNTDHFGTF